jgi:hypothetical protein
MELNWVKDMSGDYVAQGTEADGGDPVELTIKKDAVSAVRPWTLRAAGGVVGRTKTLAEAKRLGARYCEYGLSADN